MTSKQPTDPHPEGQEVQLAVYDLSNGMARALSGQILGPGHEIEIVPHTAILAFGKEYFFGGGIHSVRPTDFQQSFGMYPIQVISLGRTRVSREEFEGWCTDRGNDGTWSADTYNLLEHNCNNFSHDASLRALKLNQGVPDWILNVPRRFLSSPLGQMVRPMLEQMQIRGGAPVGAPPFATEPANPWAHIPPTTTTSSAPKKIATPILDSHSRPLLSADTATVPVCVQKLSKNDEYRSSLETLDSQLLKTTSSEDDNASLLTSTKLLCDSFVLNQNVSPKTDRTFALMLLRLIVLRTSSSASCKLAVDAATKILMNNDTDDKTNMAAKSMAWCVVSNAYGKSAAMGQDSNDVLESLVAQAVADLNPMKLTELRRAASAFLYNITRFTLSATETISELTDREVSLLLGLVEGIYDEPDGTTALRRLVSVGKLVQARPAAMSLLRDLEFVDMIKNFHTTFGLTSNGEDVQNARETAAEIVALLDA